MDNAGVFYKMEQPKYRTSLAFVRAEYYVLNCLQQSKNFTLSLILSIFINVPFWNLLLSSKFLLYLPTAQSIQGHWFDRHIYTQRRLYVGTVLT